jgi:hypothetical protein
MSVLFVTVHPLVSLDIDEIEGEDGIVDVAEEMRRSRIDINQATRIELMGLPGIGPSIASRWVETRDRVDGYRAIDDLVRLGVVSEEILREIAPYISSTDPGPTDTISLRWRRKGGWDSHQPEGRWGNTLRVIWNRDDRWESGFLADRDPGEAGLFDLWKWSISFRSVREPVLTFVAGHLRCEIARGLFFFTRSRVHRGSLVPGSIGRRGRGIGMDLSTTEDYGLRGAGARLRLTPELSLTAVVSLTRLDVARDGEGRVTTIRSSGFHSPSSTTDRDGLGLLTGLGRIELSFGSNGSFGMTLSTLRYSEAVDPPFDEGNFYAFRGSRAGFVGIDADLSPFGLGIFGEGGTDIGHGRAGLIGIESGSGKVRWSVLCRHYDPGFSPPFGNPFRDGSGTPFNETGIFTNVGLAVTGDVRITAYLDGYRRGWRRSREPFPVAEREFSVESKWRCGRGVWFRVRYLEGRGEEAVSGSERVVVRRRIIRRLRLQIDWNDRPLNFRSRYEITDVDGEGGREEGANLIYMQARFHANDRLSLDGRVTAFGSDSIDAAVYAYESELPGSMRIFPGTGMGIRWYLIGTWNVNETLRVSFKWAETRKLITEGDLPVDVSEESDHGFGLQVDYRNGY